MKNFTLRIACILAIWILFSNAFAQGVGVGQVAQNVLEPVSLFTQFMNTACWVIGTSFLFTSIIKYFEHRKTPLLVPMSTVVFLLIAGIILILLPFLQMVVS